MQADAALLTAQTKCYIQKLIISVENHFPICDFLTLFGIFDPKDIPNEVEEHANYGDTQIEKLCIKFKLPGDHNNNTLPQLY